MDLPIDRSAHPRSADEMNGLGSAGPDPGIHDIDGAGMARRLGLRFRQPSEMWPGARPGDGIFEVPIGR